MTVMPVDPAAVTYMNPYVAGGHEGFDFGATSGARFFSIGQGVVTEIELNTGQGFPGTNYRITIQYTPTIDVKRLLLQTRRIAAHSHAQTVTTVVQPVHSSVGDLAERDHIRSPLYSPLFRCPRTV